MKNYYRLFSAKSTCVTVSYLVLSVIFAMQLHSQDMTENVQRTFDVRDNTKFSISNRYGNIDIKDWDKKTIDVKVEITVLDASEKQAKEILEMISIDFSEVGNEIKVETKFDESISKAIMRRSGINDKNFDIEYTINMPKDVPVKVYNKYGNVYISENTASPKIEIKYGKLWANSLLSVDKNNMTEIILGYSDATIEECSWLKLNMKYSKTSISTSKALIVISKYSKLFMDKGSSLVSESKYDTYNVGYVKNFVTTAGYSNFRFDGVSNKIVLETRYTDTKIQQVPDGFESIKIENEYGGCKIGISRDASYKLWAHAKYAKVHYPDNARVSRFNENNEMRIDGYVGKESENMATVKIETRYGGINLIP